MDERAVRVLCAFKNARTHSQVLRWTFAPIIILKIARTKPLNIAPSPAAISRK